MVKDHTENFNVIGNPLLSLHGLLFPIKAMDILYTLSPSYIPQSFVPPVVDNRLELKDHWIHKGLTNDPLHYECTFTTVLGPLIIKITVFSQETKSPEVNFLSIHHMFHQCV